MSRKSSISEKHGCNKLAIACPSSVISLEVCKIRPLKDALKTGSRKNVARESLFSLKDSCSLSIYLSGKRKDG